MAVRGRFDFPSGLSGVWGNLDEAGDSRGAVHGEALDAAVGECEVHACGQSMSEGGAA